MSDARVPRSLRMGDLYALAAINSVGYSQITGGLYLWTRARYGYSDTGNLLLGSVFGLAYVIFSVIGGRVAERLGRLRVLVLASLGTCVAALLIALVPVWWGAYVFGALYVALSAFIWPALESSIVHARGSIAMPVRLSLYNVTWAGAAMLGVQLGGVLFGANPDWLIWSAAACPLVQCLWFAACYRPHAPAGRDAMAIPHRGAELPREFKSRSLQFAWISNALCYVLIYVLNTVSPHMGEGLSLSPSATFWLLSVPLVTRVIVFGIWMMWGGWQYRPWLSAAALLLAVAGLAVALRAHALGPSIAALAVFGAALAHIYSTSIYYSIDFGEVKGAHAGLHEAVLGLGVLAGPLVGVAGGHLTGSTAGAELAVLGVTTLVAVPAVIWFLHQEKRGRRRRTSTIAGGAPALSSPSPRGLFQRNRK